jgi:hypothetical protein
VTVNPALAVLWVVGFFRAAGLAERLSGAELVRALPPVAKQRRGFQVIPAAGVVARALTSVRRVGSSRGRRHNPADAPAAPARHF